MTKQNQFEQLNDRVEAVLVGSKAALPSADARIAALARVAAELHGLPGEEFKARLKTDLERRAAMASKPVTVSKPAPTATPYLCVRDAAGAIEFYKKAFGAIELGRLVQADGKIPHAEIQIGGALIMLADELPEYGFYSPQSLGGSPMKIHLFFDDVDALVRQAVAAGAKLSRPVQDEFYGHREGQLADPFGYTWIVSTQKEALTFAEIERRFKALTQREASAEKEPAQLREGFHTVTPYLVVEKLAAFLDFVKQAFGAEETFRAPGSAGGTHVELRIGDSMLMAGGGPGIPAFPSAIHLYVPDADGVYHRALAAGATSFYEPMDMPYGDREGGIKDGFGNSWYIATHKATGHRPAGMRAVTPTLHPRGADSLMEFMKQGLAAEELECMRTPEGMVMHAQMRIGDSVVEVGEARGPIEPTGSMLLLYVEDVEAWYRRALAAGGVSIEQPADQAYGDRRAAVKDPFGNQWYMATQRRSEEVRK